MAFSAEVANKRGAPEAAADGAAEAAAIKLLSFFCCWPRETRAESAPEAAEAEAARAKKAAAGAKAPQKVKMRTRLLETRR